MNTKELEALHYIYIYVDREVFPYLDLIKSVMRSFVFLVLRARVLVEHQLADFSTSSLLADS